MNLAIRCMCGFKLRDLHSYKTHTHTHTQMTLRVGCSQGNKKKGLARLEMMP